MLSGELCQYIDVITFENKNLLLLLLFMKLQYKQ